MVFNSIFSSEKIQLTLIKLVKKFLYGRITANQMTGLSLIWGFSAAGVIILSDFYSYKYVFLVIAAIFTSISFILDIFDGILARLSQPTLFGGIMDVFFDRIVEIVIILALIATNPSILMWSGLFSLSVIVLYVTIFLLIGGVIDIDSLTENQKNLYYSKGLIERGDIYIFLILLILLPWIRFILLWIFGTLILITVIQRFRVAYLLFHR